VSSSFPVSTYLLTYSNIVLPTFVSAKSTVINRQDASSSRVAVDSLVFQTIPNVSPAEPQHIGFFNSTTVVPRKRNQERSQSAPKKQQISTPFGFVNVSKKHQHFLVDDENGKMTMSKKSASTSSAAVSISKPAPQQTSMHTTHRQSPSTLKLGQQRSIAAAIVPSAPLTTSSLTPSTAFTTNQDGDRAPKPCGGGKRRLGMGRAAVAYPSKKFKAPST
jgi:hypothetical protein